MGSLAIYGIMVVTGIATVVGMSNQKKGKKWGQPVALIAGLLTLGMAIFSLWGTIMNDSMAQMDADAQKFEFSQGYCVAKWLGQEYSGKTVVCLTSGEKNALAVGFAKAAKEFGLDAKCPNSSELDLKGASYYEKKGMERLLKSDYKADIIVVATPPGVAANTTELLAAKGMKGKKLVVFNAGADAINLLRAKEDSTKGNLIGAVLFKMNADVESKPNNNPEYTFNLMYALLRRGANLNSDLEVYKK